MEILGTISSTLRLEDFVPIDELSKILGLLRLTNETVLQEIFRRWSLCFRTHGSEDGISDVPPNRLTALGSRCKQSATNSLKGFENRSSSVGGGLRGMMKRTCENEPENEPAVPSC